jgi:hypothetical protein
MKKTRIMLASFGVLTMMSCKKDVAKPNDESEHEAINSVTLSFSDNSGTTRTFKLEDPDGDGGNPPTRIDNITLQANKTYNLQVTLQNISGGTTKDITATVQSQSKNHEFFFLPAGVAVTINKTDRDANNYPIGLASTWITTTTGNGTVRIKLMHKPFIKGPNDAPTIGHSDLDVNLPLIIN